MNTHQKYLMQKGTEIVMRKIIIKDYNKSFPRKYLKESDRIRKILSDSGIKSKTEHFGSTAVPGLGGKGIIDIMIILDNFDKQKSKTVKSLVENGLFHKKTAGSKKRIFLSNKPLNNKDVGYHYHIVQKDSDEHLLPLAFRDALRKHPDLAKKYLELKIKLSKSQSPRQYLEGKTEFIKSILDKQTFLSS